MFRVEQIPLTALLAISVLGCVSCPAAAAVHVEGQVQVSAAPLANSTVTLWQASAGTPRQLAQVRAGADGRFELNSQESPGSDVILYLVSEGGTAAGGGENAATAMLLVLSNAPPPKVVINELTTVASAFTAARFIKGESISGNPLGLRIAAGNVPNLVDPVTGSWGKVLLDPINIAQNTTLANLNTLGSLIAAFTTVANNDWRGRLVAGVRRLSCPILLTPRPTSRSCSASPAAGCTHPASSPSMPTAISGVG
jgi:hypothetical protein